MVSGRQRLSNEFRFLALLSKCVLLTRILKDLSWRVLSYFVFYLVVKSCELCTVWLETILALVPAFTGDTGTSATRVFVGSGELNWINIVLI